MKFIPLTVSAALLSGPALAGDVELTVEIPALSVAEYHRPYIAAWIAKPDQSVAANIAVLYQQDDDAEGETWLKDLRQWWRRTGRSLDMPVDGITSPTKAPGTHRIAVPMEDPRLKALAPGDYIMMVEAAREVGGREVVSLPFTWPGDIDVSATGSSELGQITFSSNN
ncbi:DUF2271 domain-containing protein [Parvularcula sp. LCG005]|uniref:DUF2271 domain-containing protein n=1 Tax=Parvularcula sp. LCG005 TaxID=3078805 RepID=UPI0029425B42|nr:DUF2271 domain-containing protein [Parvularcula sp. LCG005]WOI52341.1 DUF2271 domain-containing protein [Parvularcula sp. LCG005]